MSTIPKWLADTVVNVFDPWLYTAEVDDMIYLSEDILSVTFSGDFYRTGFLPGHEIQFRVDDNNFRHYTIATFDELFGRITVVFYLNRKGPGSEWVMHLQKGDTLKFHAERSNMQYNKNTKHHFFFGDETSIGLFHGFKEIAHDLDHEYLGVLELRQENEIALKELKLLLETVRESADAPAVNSIQWMEDMHENCWEVWKNATYYLAGRIYSIQRFRKYLMQRGVNRGQIKAAPFWGQ
jgi:NADPH-dependent ferric siderophore reductase